MQVTGPTELDHWNVSITSTLMSPAPLIDHYPWCLILTFSELNGFPAARPHCGNCIDEVRPLKNAIFEACITDEARKLFA